MLDIKKILKGSRKNLKTIKNIYFNIVDRYEKLNETLPIQYSWLIDNYYIIEQRAKNAISSLSGIKSLPGIYDLTYKFLKSKNFNLDYDTLEKFLLQSQKDVYFENDELCTLNDYITIIIIEKIASIENLTEIEIENCIRSLRFIGTYNFEEMYEKVSYVEKMLISDKNNIYQKCDINTKRQYRNNISRYAKKHKISQCESAELLNKKAYAMETNSAVKRMYFILIYGITLFFTVMCAFILNIKNPAVISILLLLLLPLSELSKQICELVYSKRVSTVRVPKLKIDKVSDDSRTLVVITSLLFGEGKDDYLFDKLQDFYLANRDKNIKFGILGDLKDSSEIEKADDEKIISYATERINALNLKYDNMFYLFIRRRSFSKSEKRFMGWERKRGAVIELTKLIKGEDNSINTLIGDIDFINVIKYVVTLDADTNLYIGSVKEMLGAMLHPFNKPVIKDNIVIKGHAIMQPRMATTLTSASKSLFSIMISGSGGIDIYSCAAFDLYQNVFDEGIFCGKGIFDVDIFYELINKAYPEESVLSHDLLESTRLRAALITDIELTDSCPKNAISFFDRLHRWIRGDIQALAFAGKNILNSEGERTPNFINNLSKYKLYDNLRRILTPISAVLAILCALFFGKRVILATGLISILYLIFPVIAGLFSIIITKNIRTLENITRRFYSSVIPSIWHSFINVVYNISSLFYLSYISFDAVMRSFYRMKISHKHMLEWVTASENDNKKLTGIMLYIKRMFPSVIAGLILIFFIPYGYYKLLGLLWFLLPVTSYILAKENKSDVKIADTQKSVLKGYVLDMWKYYEDLAGEEDNYLPPDNYQISPVEVIAHRTSPTNIGLYMLSCLASRDFGYLTSSNLYERLHNACKSIERMSKWHGHLYNWYDTKTLNLIGSPYISTVDSGNFVTSLIALNEGLKEYINEDTRLIELINNLNQIIQDTDFSVLYDKKQNLFYLGYDTISEAYGENCYDLYMSEARTTSYYAVATGAVPKEHWAKLGRTLISKDGYIGLVSWTGTTFEYFMPLLLLPVYENSLSYEALKFAYRIQHENTHNNLWGTSESGFFAFDAEMNYQYKAFGTQKLGLKRGLDSEAVISPYSSFLMLGMSYNNVLSNLNRLKGFGMYNKYGFYEAVDFTHSRVGNGNAIIRSYMAHHIGMSIVAATNACFDNIFSKRFIQNPQMRSARELIQEKIPVDALIFNDKIVGKMNLPVKNMRFNETRATLNDDFNLLTPKVVLISNNKSKIIASSSGHVHFIDGKNAITNPYFNKFDTRKSLNLFIRADDNVYPTTSQKFEYSNDYIKYSVENEKIKSVTTYTVNGNKSCFNINLEIEGAFKTICPMLIFEPLLMSQTDYDAHPAFSNLSIEAEYLKDENILLYKRRPRLENESEKWLGVSLENQNGNIEFETRKDEVLSLLYDEASIQSITNKVLSNNTGACINPICVIKKSSMSNNGKYSCDFLFSFAKSKGEAVNIIKSTRSQKNKKYLYDFKLSMSEIIKNQLFTANITNNEIKYSELILSCIHYYYRPDKSNVMVEPMSQKNLWEHGISGDLPIVCIDLNDIKIDNNEVSKIIANFIKTQKYILIKGIRFDLVVLFSESEKYGMPLKHQISALIKSCGSEYLVSHRGGVFILNKATITSAMLTLFQSLPELYVNFDQYTTFESIYHRYMKSNKILKSITKPITAIQNILPQYENREEDGKLYVYGGYFGKDSFTVIKGVQKSPWSYIYTGKQFGTLVTQNSLGYTWCENARENRITPWKNDTLLDNQGERIILQIDDTEYDLCAISNQVEFRRGEAVYTGSINQLSFIIRVSVAVKLYIKTICVEVKNNSLEEVKFKMEYRVAPIMSVSDKSTHMIKFTQDRDAVFFRNYYSEDFSDKIGFVYSIDTDNSSEFTIEDNIVSICNEYEIESKSSIKTAFLIGVYNANSDKSYQYIREHFRTIEDILSSMVEYTNETNKLFTQIEIQTDNKSLDYMMNYYLPYQAIFVRMYARTGFYQSSGAYGFRDQLQDSLAALYIDSTITKTQILRCATHQFIKGDVQHWWHNIKSPSGYGHRGVRTKCSDDYLWLPYATAEYISRTGDYDVLEITVEYIESEELRHNETERYETPKKTTYKESIYMHCIRAIEYGMQFGIHGIPLIGTCDWNDGMSKVGVNGKGESVWLGWFLKLVLNKFIPICEKCSDSDGAAKYTKILNNISDSIEDSCYDGDWYLRGFYDDGKKLGSHENSECKIDILPQAFAAIVDGNTHSNRDRIKSGLDNAYMYLFDTKYKLFKLFTPPFVDSWQNPGYIKGYVSGIRENGGQYSHAAVWAGYGFLAFGENERGYEILNAINPAFRCCDNKLAEIYINEPYVFSGDVYTNVEHYARGGWSFYTGAAAWYYRVVLEELLGYQEHGDYFTLTPRLSSNFKKFVIMINRNSTNYKVEVQSGTENSCLIDGKSATTKFYFDNGEHFIKIIVENLTFKV